MIKSAVTITPPCGTETTTCTTFSVISLPPDTCWHHWCLGLPKSVLNSNLKNLSDTFLSLLSYTATHLLPHVLA